MIPAYERAKVLLMNSARNDLICPKCSVAMVRTELIGVDIEKCPSCEGMFFDKGEAEMLMRRELRLRRFNKKFWNWF
jgi:Zn-finger nucleic acid-binding protein